MSLLNKFERYWIDHIRPSHKKKCDYLRKKGATIGKGTRLNCTTAAFGSEPFLISVGEDCLFAAGVNFITHDGGIKVLNSLNYFQGRSMDKIGPIQIGNNVYIGMGACVMPGVKIGDNCIIGAGAVVTKDIASNSVAVGVPARIIETIDEYYAHAKDKVIYLDEMETADRKQYLIEKYMSLP